MTVILNILGIICTTFGTLLTLWTTFKTKMDEAGRINEMMERHNQFPKEKRRVIIGFALIILGSVMQILTQIF